LLARWKSLIGISFDTIIDKAVSEGRIPHKPTSPKQRIEFIRIYFKKSKEIQDVVPLYVFFKKVPDLNKSRSGEFRKNVNLKIIEPGRTTEINMDKLSEYSDIIDKFIGETKKILLK